jgi:uncharacterized protein YbgA (DUF1722 family)/uncharacterized protein YbbK (DUF523 family)
MMREFPQPRVVVSKCLGFDHCRYNGAIIPDAVVEQLAPYVTYLTVCPEVEIGLGVPRDPIRVVMREEERRLMQPATGVDLTARMEAFAAAYLDGLEAQKAIDGFILKGRSPSCGIKDVKVYAGLEKGPPLPQKTVGFFGGAVRERYGHLPVEEEGRLKNFTLREHFFTGIFTAADFRAVKAEAAMGELVRFHSDNKLLLMAYNEQELRLMGRIVANPQKKPVAEVLAEYETHLWEALAGPPRRTAGINVLMHALGYFSKQLSSEEKAYFLDSLEKYRAKKAPLSVPVSILGAWIVRFEEPYLARQTFFAPYPEPLIAISDSGKGREVS